MGSECASIRNASDGFVVTGSEGNAISDSMATSNAAHGLEISGTSKWSEKHDVDGLIRTVERGENKRDLAILQVLHDKGLRVADLVSW